MGINFNLPVQENHLKPRITVIGIGGGGNNAVNNMIECGLEGVEFVASNTDAQSLEQSIAQRKIQLGPSLTQGLGAGSRPDIGRAAAEEVIDSLLEQLAGANMVFLAAGMGGGTGTGAAPVIARAAKEQDILTVGVVTKPFDFEGVTRMRVAEQGIEELQQFVDTLIVIPNQNLFRVANEKTTFAEAFSMADDVLQTGVRGITDLMLKPGLINLDFADIRAVMAEMGKAQMGTGECEGDHRAVNAAEAAISNPILEDSSMKGAHGVLINITGGSDMTMFEVDEAANRIKEEVDSQANIIFGAAIDDSLSGRIRVSMVATGIDAEMAVHPHDREENIRRFSVPPALAASSQSDTLQREKPRQAAIGSIFPLASENKDRPEHPALPGGYSSSQMPENQPDQSPLTMQGNGSPASPEQPSDGYQNMQTGEPLKEEKPHHNHALNSPSGEQITAKNINPEPSPAGENIPKKASVSLFRRITGSRTGQRKTTAQQNAGIVTDQPDHQHADFQDHYLRHSRENKPGEEDLLEIPAFLRRQAN